MAAGVSDGALIIDTGLNNNGFIRDAAQFRRAVEGLTQAVRTSGQRMAGGMDSYLQELQRASAAAKGAAMDQAGITKEIAKTEAALKRLNEKEELARRKWEASREAAEEKAAADFSEANAGADLMPWENELEAAEQMAEALNQRVREVSESFGEFEDTPVFRNINVEIEVMQEKLAALKAQLATLQQPQDNGAAEQAKQQAEQTADQAGSAWQRFGGVVGKAAGGFVKVAGAALRAGASIAKVAGGGALGFLRRLAEGAQNAAIQMAKLTGSAIGSGFKTLGQGILAAGKWMLGLNHSAGEVSGSFKKGLWAILKYGLGIRSLYFLFRKVRTAISESLGEIAKQNPVVNAQLKAMKGALNGLKGSLGAAFAPIFTAVAPALTYLINMLTSAINAIAAFMAALTGQKTYQKAVAGISGAGDAASGAGSAADKATESYEKLKRELAGFDDLDMLGSTDTDSGSGDGSGGGGGGGSGGISYSTEEIGSGITDFIGKVKEMWENADYEGIGKAIAGTINSAFAKAKEWISWDNLGATITEAVNGITGIFNGLVDAVNWELIGQTFGEGINTLVNTCNLLLTGIDWENLGKSLADGLNGLIDTVNWDNLGQLFANKLNALIGVISGAVTNFKWGNAGTAFATAVNGLLDTVDWTKLATTAATSINGIVTALKNTITTFKWGQVGTTFATTVNGIIDGIDWTELGATAAAGINGVVTTLKNAITKFKWGDAATKLVTAINQLFDDVDWDALGEVASKAINGILATMKTLVSGFRWDNAATNITNAINRLFDGVDWDALSDTVTTALNKIIATIKTTVSGFRWANAGTTFGNTLNSLFSGTNWTELGETAAAAIAGPLEAIKNAVTTFSFGDAAKDFADAVNGFFSNEQMWADAGTIVSESIKGMFTFGKDFFDNLDTDQISGDIKDFIKDIDWAGIAQAIWDFLVSALKAIGSLLWELLVETDVPPETAAAVEKEVEQMLSKFHPELKVTWGIDLNDPNGQAQYDALVKAFQNGLAGKGFKVPADLEIPAESIAACYNEFVEEWNKIHPGAPLEPILPENVGPLIEKQLEGVDAEVPVDPSLPENAGQVIEDEWAAQDPDLKTDVDATLNPTNTPASAFDVSTILNFLGTLGKKDTNQSPGIIFAVNTALAFLGTLSRKDDNQKPGIVFSVATALGFKGTLSQKDKDQKPGAVFGVATALGFKGTLSQKDKDQKPGAVFGVATALAFLGTLALKNKDQKPGAVFSVSKALAFLGTLKLKDKKYRPATVMSAGSTYKYFGELIKGWSGSAIKALGLDDLKTKVKVNLEKGDKDTVIIKPANSKGEVKMEVKRLGGVLMNGIWRGIPQYAGGTANAHGSMFIAGEAGPELVGHIGGRTEVLNRSQLAATMYSAVLAAMNQAVSALGTFLSGQLANCTNAIVGTIGNLAAVANIQYHEPVMASGTVLPYDVAAQVARTGMDLQNTLDANNEDLIQTIISVAGQIVAAVQSSANREPATGTRVNGGLTARQLIDDINRRAQMFGSSPILD